MQSIMPVTLKKMFHQSSLAPFPHLLNLWAIEDDAVIGLDLQFSFVYEIISPDLAHKTDSELGGFFQSIKNCLHSLPENITLQFLVQCRKGDNDAIEDYIKSINPQGEIERLTVENKIKHFKGAFLQKRKYYLFVTTYPPQTDLSKFKVSAFSIANTDYKKITKQQHDARIRFLKELHSQLIPSLNACGVQTRQMKSDEISHLLYEYLNPARSQFLDPKTISPDETLRSQIALNACEFGFDHLYLDGHYFRAVNLHTRPNSTHFMMMNHLIDSMEPDFDLSVTLQSGDQDQWIDQIRFDSTIASVIGGMNPFKKYEEAELKALHADNLINEVKSTFQKLYRVSLCVILRDRSLEELTTRTNQAVQKFRILGEAEGVIDDMNHLPLFLSMMPNHSQWNFRNFMIHTEAAAQMIPLSAPWVGCREAKMLLKTEDDQMLPIHLFETEITSSAKCGLVVGTQGSGKSFTVNYILGSFYIESVKNHVIVIDKGDSYRKICSLFGGECLQVDLSGKYAFNPFPSKASAIVSMWLRTEYPEQTDSQIFEAIAKMSEEQIREALNMLAGNPEKFKVDPDVLGFLTTIVQKMLKLPELSGREQIILEKAIANAYLYSKTDPPLLQSLHYQLMHYVGDDEDKQSAKSFAKNLEIWTTGSYGELVNRPSTIHPKSRFIVFELQKLDQLPELQSIIFFLIRSVIDGKLIDRSLQKMVILDEAWSFFSDPIGSKLVNNLYKTIRKFGGVVWTISQSPKDFLDTPAADAIITNSLVKIILSLESGHDLLPRFKLTDPEIESTKQLRATQTYREVFLKFADYCRVVKIEPSPVDYWICTTNAKDYTIEMNYRKLHPDFNVCQVLDGLSKLTGEERIKLLNREKKNDA